MEKLNVNGQMSNVIQGIFGIYKPKGPTSFRVISELRRITGIKTIGHAGTLDPLASGVLVVAIGREFTRQINEAVETEKEYVAHIKLGFESTTDDEEGAKTPFTINKEPLTVDLEKAVEKFKGKIMQTPPIYSALKVGGKPLYKFARKGQDVEIKPREVEIKDIEILGYNYPELVIKVITGKGVYIRALARDIGRELGTGGYLTDLERTRVGQFTKEKSMTIAQFEQKILNDEFRILNK